MVHRPKWIGAGMRVFRHRASHSSDTWRPVLACAFVIVVAAAFTWALTSRSARGGHPTDSPEGMPIERPVGAGSPSSRQAQPPPEPQPLATALIVLRPSAAERAALEELYGPRGVVPLWLADGRLTPEARDAEAVLSSAARHGLNPADYLLGPAAVPDAAVPLEPQAQAASDVALSLGVLRYMRHLHLGRVDPRGVGLRLDAWAEPHEFAAVLREAAAAGRVPAALDALAPPFVVYTRLVEALAQYRAIAARHDPALSPFIRAVKPGEAYPAAHALGVHLAARGDLNEADVPEPEANLYEGAIVEGVQRFQSRHGLTPDGALGARTVAALLVPASERVRQIEMALERLRWLPDLGERRLIVVNIPMFRLWAWDTLGGAQTPAFSTSVIVGKAMRTETPVFVETMQHVIFRPYWNVPRSILLGEVLPAMQRDPAYLTRQQMEVVAGQGDDARPLAVGPGTLDALRAGSLRVRQRPGPNNALGLVKFIFPNREGVYLHGTPTPSLFARDRRDFSHGCIRVADPPGLARWALDSVGRWDAGRIDQAMHADVSERVDLPMSIDVVLFYLTAAVLPEDDAVHFADDIYGHDVALGRALAQVATGR